MHHPLTTAVLPAALSIMLGGASAPVFVNETASRLPVPPNDPALTTTDDSEKSYAFGDLDNDGDLDLVIARRPAYQFGERTNVLLLNEGGVLIDRTAQYAAASYVAGDEGFLTPTSDRDIAVGDVNGDGWLDVVTAVAFGEGAAKHLSHPRIYINRGSRDGEWLGLQHEDARIPTLHATAAPRFQSVSVGDVNGDGAVDLWFTDFDVSESPFAPTEEFDFNSRLLINDGNGLFSDETARLLGALSNTAYGTSGAIADMNGDGAPELIRNSSNLPPFGVGIIYNDPAAPGSFTTIQTVYAFPNSSYYTSTGDLNNDGLIDLVITDNGIDRYMLNQGAAASGQAMLSLHQFPSTVPGIEFGGNSYPADLNNDDFLDVVITDMDVDVPGCSRRAHIFINNANPPTVGFAEPANGIPSSMLMGTHDAAVFDINGDGWRDLMLGRCGSTEVWISQPLGTPCRADLNDSGDVNAADLALLLGNWNCTAECTAELSGSPPVDAADLALLLGAWGDCPAE